MKNCNENETSTLWNDPIADARKEQIIFKEFTKEESLAINNRLNKSIEASLLESRREEAKALEHASRAFLTF